MSDTVNHLVPTRRSPTRTMSITSGKGGVGKTTLVVNLAQCLSRKGHKVLILDGDLGMANVDIMFGLRAPFSVRDVFKGTKRIEDVLVNVDQNIWLLPGGSGFHELQDLGLREKRMLLDQLSLLPINFDDMLIDTSPGIDTNVMYFNISAQDIAVVITPDPSSFTDAYALIKVLNTYYGEKRFSVIANQVRDEQEGLHLYQKLSDVSSRFLYVSLDYLGSVPSDPQVKKAVRGQQIFVKSSPDTAASRAMRDLTDRLLGLDLAENMKGGIQFFWEQIMGVA